MRKWFKIPDTSRIRRCVRLRNKELWLNIGVTLFIVCSLAFLGIIIVKACMNMIEKYGTTGKIVVYGGLVFVLVLFVYPVVRNSGND